MTTVRGLVMAAVLIATSAWPGVAVAQETPSRVDALSARLASENERTRESAAEALGRLGARALVAAPLLLARTADEDEYVAAAAIIALARVTRDQDSAALAQTLRRLASDTAKPTAVRAAAMTALGYCVPDAATVDTLLAGHAEGRDAWKVSSRAGAALVRLGRAAVPAIAAQLDSRDEAAISRALALLAAIGPAAEEAVPAMIRHFGNDDGDLRTAAWKAVARVGAAAVPSLIDAAGRGSENHRVAAMRAIEQLGDLAREAAPALMAALNQSSLWIVAAAARALVATGGITPAAAPRLTALLGETNDSICAVCARALGAIGPAAREAIPALVAGLERRLRDTFNAIADAIRRIDLAAAIAPLLAALDHAEPLVRSRAATLLGGLDDNNRSRAIPRLIRALDDVSQPTPLAAAAAALAALGATDAVPRLRELASHTDAYIRNIATCALAKLRDTTVVPLLIEQVSNGGLYHIYREAACRALGDVPDQSAVPALLAAMRDPQIELQEAAIATLGAFGAVAADAVPRLTGILANPRGPMGRHLDEAAAALVSIGAPAVDAVAALLESGDTGVRYLAARFLARFGPAARPALDRLRKALADHDREVVVAVICAIAA
ncbi:MAG: HEAT repeat domain-containing protein, partial [Planctomycetota bacterium]